MLRNPTFKPHLRVEVLEGNGLFVLFEGHQTVLQGKLYEMVAPLLDGRSIEKISEALLPHAPPSKVFYAINKLQQTGLLCEKQETFPVNEAAFWSMQGLEPGTIEERRNATPVSLRPIGLDPSPLHDLLEVEGVRFDYEVGFRVVLADHYLRKELGDINREALETGKPWMLVRPVGSQLWLGPIFRPGSSACFECLAHRIRANFPIEGFLDRSRNGHEPPPPTLICTPATLALAWGMVANIVSTFISHGGAYEPLEGKLLTFDLMTWKSQTHQLIKNPLCTACGLCACDSATCTKPKVKKTDVASPIELQSRKKTYTEDGGHRSMSPQETIDRYSHHVSPICGAVTLLERSVKVGEGVFHVYESGNNIARSPSSFHGLKSDLRNASCGKGINDLQAKASALCEALERHASVFRGDEPFRRAKFSDFKKGEAIHPNDCMLFSEHQYSTRESWNQRHSSVFCYVPRMFDPNFEMDWTPVWSLTHQTSRYLPTAYLYFNYPHECGLDFFMSCSNGNSAGNTIEEAIVQGFFELVERDAVGIWWSNRYQAPGVDLASFEEPYLNRLEQFFKSKGREIWALDLTSDLGIPVMAAFTRRIVGGAEQILFGFGAHFDPRIALLRAVTEMNQMVAHLMDLPDGQLPAHLNEEDTVDWLKNATLANQPYLQPRPGPTHRADHYPRVWTDDLKEDIELCRDRVEKLGLEMLVVNHTRAEIGMPVVKVLVPGLRHFWPRFAPGRLYDVPVQMGWLQSPNREEDLNPIPMFL